MSFAADKPRKLALSVPSLFVDDSSPASSGSSGNILAANPGEASTSPRCVVRRELSMSPSMHSAALKESPSLKHGTIIKGHRRGVSLLRRATTYTVREKPPPEGRWVIIVNGTKLKQWEAVAHRLLKQLASVEVRVYATKYPGHGRKLAHRAALNDADLIAAVGGDGTLNEVIDGVMRAGVLDADGLPKAVVTVLPLGTASDFHRSMAWDPTDFEAAMWRIGSRGETAVLDLAHIRCQGPDGAKDRFFINVASCGASAKAALGVHKWKWLGGKGSYRMATIGALFKSIPKTLAVRVDGGEWAKASGTTMMAIGNGSYFGNGLNIAPGANPFDGRLQVVTATHMGVGDMLFSGDKLKMGKHLDMKGFSSQDVTTIDVALWDKKLQGPAERGAYEVFQAPYDASPGGTTPESSFTTRENYSPAYVPDGRLRDADWSLGATAQEWSSSGPSGSEVSTRTASTVSSLHRGEIKEDATSAAAKKAAAAAVERSAKSATSRSKVRGVAGEILAPAPGQVMVEVDGEVIGWAPFSVTVLPGAIKFRV